MTDPKKKISSTFNGQSGTIKVTEFKGHGIHVVEDGNDRSTALFLQAYKEVYEPAFPIPEERQSLKICLEDLSGKSRHSNIVIALIGHNMETEQPIIQGIVIGYYYHKEDVGLLAYTATSPAHRNLGLGHIQVDVIGQALLDLAKRKGGTLQGFFLECNDPAKVSPEKDSFDPATRIKIFEKWGARVLPIDYVQPSLEKGVNKCDTLKLLAYPHPETGEYPTPDGIKRFIKGIYEACAKYDGVVPAANPDYIKTMGQIDALKKKPPSAPKPSL